MALNRPVTTAADGVNPTCSCISREVDASLWRPATRQRKPHFHCLHPQFRSFGHDLVVITEDRKPMAESQM